MAQATPNHDHLTLRAGLAHYRGHQPTARELAAMRDRQDNLNARFRETLQGRFIACLDVIEQDYPGEAGDARSAFCRGFADPEKPARVIEIGVALAALVGVDSDAARDACDLLRELLAREVAA